ncbi:hypothetical protein [Bdellovibrio svalbardensis]|uniref:Lipoprotein n=1 Tax=Bdellovibrio svalbardensis TaxID=2972972 RepID=A0ABT6DHX5_9BACT|nr:hypothetical protein [Bdellovibrio svalbardensis]MDG0816077.1 hypothetical protein [Bdellovibrio svalbardensis]
MAVFWDFWKFLTLAFVAALLSACSIEASLEALSPQFFQTTVESGATRVSTFKASGTEFSSKSVSGDGRYKVKSTVGPMVSHLKVRSGIYDVDLN